MLESWLGWGFGGVGSGCWLYLAGMGCRFGCVVDLVGLEFCLGWIGHLLRLDIWSGLSFCWVSHLVCVIHLVGLEIWLAWEGDSL